MYIVSGEDRYDGEVEKEFDANEFFAAEMMAVRIREEGGWADVYDENGIIEI